MSRVEMFALYLLHELKVAVNRQNGGNFTLHSDLKTAVRLSVYRGILKHSKTRAVNVCETGILP